MTDITLAYWNFWSKAIPFNGGFLPAYPEQTVPTGTALPYLTYTLTRSDAFQQALDTVRVWTRSTNIQQLSGFLDAVSEAIPPIGGIRLMLPDNKGVLWLRRGSPWQQRQSMDENDLQVGYCNVIVGNFAF